MNKNFNKIILCLIAFTSCKQAPESTKPNTDDFFSNPQEIQSLIEKADKGDTLAYNEIFVKYHSAGRLNELLYNSFTMAHKYNYSKAYYDVFQIISTEGTGGVFNDIDKKTQNLALYYLAVSREKGYEGAKTEFGFIIGKDKIMSKSSFYLSEFEKLDSLTRGN